MLIELISTTNLTINKMQVDIACANTQSDVRSLHKNSNIRLTYIKKGMALFDSSCFKICIALLSYHKPFYQN